MTTCDNDRVERIYNLADKMYPELENILATHRQEHMVQGVSHSESASVFVLALHRTVSTALLIQLVAIKDEFRDKFINKFLGNIIDYSKNRVAKLIKGGILDD
jgi:hypothetical protein